MITIKSAREIEGMAESGAILAGMHKAVADIIRPGVSSWEIEKVGREYIESHGAIPAELGFEGYKYATCVSINDEVAHAVPRKGLDLKAGDIVAVDTVVDYHGYFSDSCWTYAVGEISEKKQKLMDITKQALYLGIDAAQVGNRIGDIGYAIQHFTEDEHGYGDVRELIGHGIQPTMHESPNVPHYGEPGHGLRLKAGMTITIEPMITTGTWKIKAKQVPNDDWEYYVTADGSDCAQYEHTIVITDDGPKILTSQDPVADAKYLLK
ncbi:type I methionyl aminopeptidase [Lacticaseibacillus nasuensis]|uniref:Methionine aminopeptidase n=1 Tax=Lacticaseibacillus nasuensis JCM 17158 TaxID=1291734 RepID=A0A0R1JTJ8_9LACO|nr:type I methionyl aminopeptidase [Lacticaseibacillus nasuensis]KRK71796.1 methionine aminopeptidase [Lacticaseibacillus nasuensis JCM 17158]MCX2455469.1 type I methionyl aminopeptidase [Lacticaseibacillus nasuensis]